MYPPHLNYATTLPCKTLTMKITIFITMLVLKSEENIACYQFKSLWKQLISKHVQSVRPQLSDKLEVFWRCSICWLDLTCWLDFCRRSSHIDCKIDFLRLVDGIWLGLKCLVAFTHSSSDMIVKSFKVWWLRWPSVFSDEVTAVGGIQFGASFAVWAGALSCWNMKPDSKQDLQSSISLGNRLSRWSLLFTFALSGMKCSLPFPPSHSTQQQRSWRAWQISPFRLPGDFCRHLFFVPADQTRSFWCLTGKSCFHQ